LLIVEVKAAFKYLIYCFLDRVIGLSDSFQPCIAPAIKTFAQPAPGTAIRHFFCNKQLGFAFPAEVLLPGLHGTVTRSDGHRTELNAVITTFTELLAYIQGTLNVTVLTSTDKAESIGMPHLSTGTDTPSA
jgi:hypothetical protein